MNQVQQQSSYLRQLGAIALLFVVAHSVAADSEPSSKGPKLRVGCYVEHQIEADPNAIQSALTKWATVVAPSPQHHIDARIETSRRRWFESIENESHDLYSLFAYQYLELPDPTLLKPALVTSNGQGITSCFVLLTRSSDSIQSIAQLKNRKIIVNTGGVGELPLIWLATIIAESTAPENVADFAHLTLTQSAHHAILPLYFDQADACIIKVSDFSEACTLNSEIGTRLEATHTSPPFLISLFAFNRKYPEADAEKIVSAALTHSRDQTTTTFLELVGRKELIAFDPSALNTVQRLHQDYKRIFTPNPSIKQPKGGAQR